MNAVGLHAAGDAIDALQQERQQRHVILGRQQRVRLVELPDVVGAIIPRQRDTAQHYLDAGIEQSGDDEVEILAGTRDGQSAQAIVSAKSHDHQDGFQAQCVLQPIDSVFGGVSTDPLIDHLIPVAHRVQVLLQVIGIAVARRRRRSRR